MAQPDDAGGRPALRQPWSPEAETACLGSIFLKNELAGELLGLLSPEDFFDGRHRVILEAIRECRGIAETGPADLITVTNHLKTRNLLAKAGGVEFMNGLVDSVPTTAHFSHYLGIVSEKSLQRRLMDCGDRIKGWATDPETAIPEALDKSLEAVFDLSKNRDSREITHIREALQETVNYIEEAYRNKGQMGIPTGFRGLDQVIGGLQKGNLIIIGARPGMGKTSLVLSMVENMCIYREKPVPVGIFSLEMGASELSLRMLSSISRIPSEKFHLAGIVERDWPAIMAGVERLSLAPIYIDDNSALTFSELTSKARRMVKQFGVQLLILDYLQLMNTGAVKGTANRQEFIAEVSRGLKQVARSLKIPVVALTQLNRNIESRAGGDRKPQLSDIRESGAIEQDADLVLFLYKEEEQAREGEAPPDGSGDLRHLTIAKNRHGQNDVKVDLWFEKRFTRFQNYTPQTHE